MRIAILNWRDSSHPEAGGAELYSESVARELAAEGHDVTLVTSRPAATAPRERRDGYRVVRRGGRFTLYPWVLLWLLRHRNRIDGVIDSQNGIPFFSPLVVGRRVPVVLLMHHVHQDQFALYFGPLVARVGRWLESTAARRVYGRRTVAAVSPSTRAAVRTRLRLRGPVHLAPCGLGEAAAPSVTVRGSVPRIVCVGRLVPHKRLDLLLDALPAVLARVPGLVVDLVGDGQDRDALAPRAARLGLGDAVTVHGRLPDAERDALLAAAWLTVNPTQGEGWGLSVLEANRAGVPAVAFTVEGLRDSVLPGETGWLVEEDGPGGRAGRVERLADTVSGALDDLTDPAAAARLRRATTAWAASFRWDRTADTLTQLLGQEHARLHLQPDRRAASDLAVTVTIPAELVEADRPRGLRDPDGWLVLPSAQRQLLLHGVGHAEVPAVLTRLGLGHLARRPDVEVEVARPRELLRWTAAGRDRSPDRPEVGP